LHRLHVYLVGKKINKENKMEEVEMKRYGETTNFDLYAEEEPMMKNRRR